MIVKEYDSVKTFLEDYERLMLVREPVCQLILYNALQNHDNIEEVYGSVIEEEATLLLFCYQKPGNLYMYTVVQDKAADSAAILGDYYGNSKNVITNINARLDLCESFMKQYEKHIPCDFIQRVGTNIMEIRMVNDITPIEGEQRLAMPEEAKMITDWIIRFQMEELASELDYEAALKNVEQYIEDQKVYLYINMDKVPVTMAIAERKLVHGMAVTHIFTPEEHRGKGYAATNMYYLSKKLLEQGYEFCTLFVDIKNPLSNRAYEKVGFKILENYYEYQVIPNE